MATISITKKHHKSRADVERLVDELGSVLEREFGCNCDRSDEMLEISRRGVDGSVTLREGEVDVEVRLGPMMSIFASRLKPLIEARLDQHLDD